MESRVAVRVKFVGGHVTLDGQVLPRGLKVLANVENAAPHLPRIAHDGLDLVGRFPDPHHNAGFGHHAAPGAVLQHRQRLRVVSLWTHLGIEPWDGFDIVPQYSGFDVYHGIQCGQISAEIRNQDLDQDSRHGVLDPPNRLGPDRRPPVG